MVAVLITTGKKPGKGIRAIAKALFSAVPASCLEGRGSRTLASLISRAKKRHLDRVCAIYSEDGKPSHIAFLSLENEGHHWLSPKIKIKSVAASPSISKTKAKKGQAAGIKITGAKAATLSALLGAASSKRDEPISTMSASASKITIFSDGRKTLELGVAYEK